MTRASGSRSPGFGLERERRCPGSIAGLCGYRTPSWETVRNAITRPARNRSAHGSTLGATWVVGRTDQRPWRSGGGEGAIGEAQHELTDGAPLRVVGIQQGFGRQAAAHQGHLPAEVDRVLNAGVHALGACWAVDMRRVAGKEGPTGPVATGVAVVDAECRRPHRVVQLHPPVGGLPAECLQLSQRDCVHPP